ncbi:MAG: hypothetical protein AAGD01_10875 [Acidobacteriota bacterium]
MTSALAASIEESALPRAAEDWSPLARWIDDGATGDEALGGRLPGGWPEGGEGDRSFRFRPMTGAVELELAESMARGPWPRRVSAALAAVLETVAGEAATVERVEALAVGDRQLLARALDLWLGQQGGDDGQRWMTAPCSACDESFDFSLHLAELPVKAAAPGFPQTTVELPWGAVELRAPTGKDQLALSLPPSDDDFAEAESKVEDPSLRLLRRLLCRQTAAPTGKGQKKDQKTAKAEALSRDQLEELLPRAQEALESMAPAVAESVAASCPHCAEVTAVHVDPYLALESASAKGILDDVHQLASAYGWTEEAILALPRSRRRAYLERLDRARGMRS